MNRTWEVTRTYVVQADSAEEAILATRHSVYTAHAEELFMCPGCNDWFPEFELTPARICDLCTVAGR